MGRRTLVEGVRDPRISALIAHVEAFSPDNPRSVSGVGRLLAFLDSAARPFERESGRSHVTGSAVVLSDRGVLLHRHKLSGLWLGPGGHVDGDEHPCQGAVRETLEETGLVAGHPAPGPVIANVDVHLTSNDHVHFDVVYVLMAEAVDPAPPAGESQEVGWFEPDAALDMTDGSHACAIRNALAMA